jgi:hypothetical protein
MRKSSNLSRSSRSKSRSLFSENDSSEDLNGSSHHGYEETKGATIQDTFDLPEIHANIIGFVGNLLPQAILLRDFNGNFVYQIPLQGFNAERLFLAMEKHKDRLRIADWGISQCSLEDVFTRICGGDA